MQRELSGGERDGKRENYIILQVEMECNNSDDETPADGTNKQDQQVCKTGFTTFQQKIDKHVPIDTYVFTCRT